MLNEEQVMEFVEELLQTLRELSNKVSARVGEHARAELYPEVARPSSSPRSGRVVDQCWHVRNVAQTTQGYRQICNWLTLRVGPAYGQDLDKRFKDLMRKAKDADRQRPTSLATMTLCFAIGDLLDYLDGLRTVVFEQKILGSDRRTLFLTKLAQHSVKRTIWIRDSQKSRSDYARWGEFAKRIAKGLRRQLRRLVDSNPDLPGLPALRASPEQNVDALIDWCRCAGLVDVGNQTEAVRGAHPGLTVATLREMTGLSSSTLTKYAKRAKVQRPERGQQNFRYPVTDACAILETIIAESSQETARAACAKALQDLKKIAN